MKGYGLTDRGKVRQENQDNFLIRMLPETETAVAVLCDGMGGAQAGSTASEMACASFMGHICGCLQDPLENRDLPELLTEAVSYANIKVFDRSYMDFGCMGMGTTLVCALCRGDAALVANVGDSRAYLVADGQAKLVTRDHSLVEELVTRGKLSREDAKNHPQKNMITRALGVEQKVQADIFSIDFSPGRALLLCSDGLSNLVSDEELGLAFKTGPDPQTICRTLMDLALKRGARDNVTVAVLIR